MFGNRVESAHARAQFTGVTGLLIVSLSDGNRNFGLYHVKHVAMWAMVIAKGAYSFSIGTQLDVEDYLYRTPCDDSFHKRVTVIDSRNDGIQLSWR